MDRFVKNFIAVSIFYLALASIIGVVMGVRPQTLGYLKFAHSHLMLIGWVTMMIYGVGYHVLPRFAGKLIKNKGLADIQFWIANVGLVGMVIFYTLMQMGQDYRLLFGISATLQVASSLIFFYNMVTTLYSSDETH